MLMPFLLGKSGITHYQLTEGYDTSCNLYDFLIIEAIPLLRIY